MKSLEEMLVEAAAKGARNAGDGPFAEMLDALAEERKAGRIPDAKHCATTRELAAWFTRFAWACRANLPAPTPS